MPDRVYLDHAATTDVLPEVVDEVAAQMRRPGNASSLHTAGRAARRVVEESRESIAEALGARPSEVVFTSGGTESDNLALVGSWLARSRAETPRRRVAVSAIEHHAVLDAAEHLESVGAPVDYLPVDGDARVSMEAAREIVGDDLAVLSVMWANNEVGTVQPVAELAELAREHGVPFHTDAVQALGQVEVDFAASGADLLTFTGHKIGGPLNTGALLARRDAAVQPLTFGGGQERNLRSGTIDVPGVAGLAVAVRAVVAERERHAAHLVRLRDRLVEEVRALDLGVVVGGRYEPGDTEHRVAGNAHLRIPGCDGDSLLYLLDAAGVEVSTGSACQAGVPRPSHVLLAMGVEPADARGSIRVSLGRSSTDADVDAFLAALPAAVERARKASGAAS